MDMSDAIKKTNEKGEVIKTIIRMGVFVYAAHDIGLSMEEIKDIITYIAKKREDKRNGKEL